MAGNICSIGEDNNNDFLLGEHVHRLHMINPTLKSLRLVKNDGLYLGGRVKSGLASCSRVFVDLNHVDIFGKSKAELRMF